MFHVKQSHHAKLAAGLSLGLALTLGACSSSSSPTPSPTSAASEVLPIDQAAMQATLDATIKELLVPGSIALVRTPAGAYTAASGTTMLDAQIPPTAADHFRIGSVTKTMTAAVVLQLAQEGKLGLQDPIDRFVPGVPNGASITVAQLLEMRSGLFNYLRTDVFTADFGADPTKVWTPQQLVELAYAYPPNFPPGTDYDYSNTNTILLGMLIEKLDGKPLAESFSTRLFTPLGMAETSLPAPTNVALAAPSTNGYQYGPLQVEDETLTPEQDAAARAGTLKPNDVTAQSSSWGWAAGGVVSTADDLQTWIEAFVGGRVLSVDMQRRWWDSIQLQHASDKRLYYGYGITQLRFGGIRLTYHEGQMPGYNTMAVYDDANDVSIVIWTNLAITQDRDNALSVLVAMLPHIYRTPPDTPPAD